MAYPLVSVIPFGPGERPLTARERAEYERVRRDAEQANDSRSDAFDYSMDRMEDMTKRYGRHLRDNRPVFIEGVGYTTPREQAASSIVNAGDRYAFSRADETIPESVRFSAAGRALDQVFLDYPLRAVQSTAEGVLAGLSAPTEGSQGFLPEVTKGLSAWVDPSGGVDSATLDRLYRSRSGEQLEGWDRFVAEQLPNPVNWIWSPAVMRGKVPSGIRTELVDRHGDVIRRLRNAEPAPRLGLPAP